MNKKIIIVILCIFCFSVYSRDNFFLSEENPLGNDVSVGRQYFFLIGINNYKYWPNLTHPAIDVKEVRDILKEQYFVDKIIELYNEEATKENIIQKFTELQAQLSVHDSLFIMYAGHGYFDQQLDSGFWIPSNAGTDKIEQANWLSNHQIHDLISKIEASHLLLVSDSCFAGKILQIDRGFNIPDPMDIPYYAKTYPRISRQVLTSGARETVPDESEFAFQLKMALKKNIQPLLDPSTLYNEIKLGVIESTPLFGTIKDVGHQEGANFLLFKKIEENYGAMNVMCGGDGKLYINGMFYDDVKQSTIIIDDLVPGEYSVMIKYASGRTEEKNVSLEKGKTESISFIPTVDIPSENIPPEKQKPFTITLSGAYSVPGMGEMTDYFAPALYTDLIVSYNLFNLPVFNLSILLGGNFAVHEEAAGTSEDSFLLYSGILGGLGITLLMPFYSPLTLSLSLCGGIGYSYIDNEFYNDTDYETWNALASVAACQLGVQHQLGKLFLVSGKISYMIIMYMPESEYWLHEMSAGVGIGIRF